MGSLGKFQVARMISQNRLRERAAR